MKYVLFKGEFSIIEPLGKSTYFSECVLYKINCRVNRNDKEYIGYVKRKIFCLLKLFSCASYFLQFKVFFTVILKYIFADIAHLYR